MEKRYRHIFEIIFIGILAFMLVYGILAASGALYTGYHMVDDHEVVQMEHDFQQGRTYGQTVTAYIHSDMRWRFRPFYWVERVFVSYCFGKNMILWNIYTAFKGCVAFSLLYFAARNVKCSWYCSLLFAGMTIFGQQFVPFFRSANQENSGLCMCALILWILTWQYREQKYRHIGSNIALCVCCVICGLMKESFALCIPAFLALKLWFEYYDVNTEESRTGVLGRCIRDNLWVYLTIFLVFLTDLYFILFKIGTDKVSYAGFHEGTTWKMYLLYVYQNLAIYTRFHTLMGIIAIFTIVMANDWTRKPDKKTIVKYSGFILINCYVMGIQLIAHATSRMVERYVIPYIVSFAALVVILGLHYFSHMKVQRVIYSILLASFVMLQMRTSYHKALEWSEEGEAIAELFHFIQDNIGEEKHLLCAFADEEINLSVETWLEADGWPGLLSYRFEQSQIADLVGISANTWEHPSIESADAVLCYDYYVPIVKSLMGVEEETACEVYEFRQYVMIVR